MNEKHSAAPAILRRRLLDAMFAIMVVGLSACAAHPNIAVSKPAIHSIAIIPASNPSVYSFENATPPVGYPFQYWVNKSDSRSKAKLFNDKMSEPPLNLGETLTKEVAAALRERGFEVEILSNVQRPPKEPDNVDYDKVDAHADAILHVWIDEVGLYSSHTSTDYIPRVNINARLFVKGREDNIYGDDLYYGVDAKKGKEWAILPDPKFAYPTFGAVMGNLTSVRSSFQEGTSAIVSKIAQQIVDSPNYVRN